MPARLFQLKPEQKRRLIFAIYVTAILLAIEGYLELKLRRNQSQECLALMQHNLAPLARMWAVEHGAHLPTNYNCLARVDDVVDQPRFWVCPADVRNPMLNERDWSRFRPELASYELVSPGASTADTNAILFRCKIHHSICYADGSVAQGAGAQRQWPTNNSLRLIVR